MLKLTLASAVLVTAAGLATAATKLPISGAYGSANACALYAAGGGNAVFSAGASIGQHAAVDADEPEYMVVSPTEVVGHEWACEPVSIDGSTVTMQCPGSQVSADFGEPELLTVIIREDAADATLSYTDETGTVILPECGG
jgi:hypothetical protein